MSTTPSDDQIFTRDQAALILHEAARSEPSALQRAAPRMTSGDDHLSLGELQRAAHEVGIAPRAVATASLRVALRSAQAGTGRVHHVHEVEGELTERGWEQLGAQLRTLVTPSDVRRTAEGLELELKKSDSEPGSLLVQIRSAHGATLVSLWSEAPRSKHGELVAFGMIGVPTALFPVVAVSAGQWPSLLPAAALASAGAAIGTALGALWQRQRAARWQARVEQIVMPVAALVAELTDERSGR